MIDKIFHFYETLESFELHKRQGLINPDSICFIKETSQAYTQNTFIGICKKRYEELEQLVLEHNAKINNILGIEGPSVKDGIVNNIADLVNFLDGFTDEDNLKDFIETLKNTLVAQINAVHAYFSEKIDTLESQINSDTEIFTNTLKSLESKLDTVDIRLDNLDTVTNTLNTTLASHIREYNILKDNYEAFKTYADNKFTSINNSVKSLNNSVEVLQDYFKELEDKFDRVEDKISHTDAMFDETKELIKELNDRFGNTLVEINNFKKDIHNEMDDFKSLVGEPLGIAPLDNDCKVPAANLPSYVDDVLEYITLGAFPLVGESGKIYVAKDTNLTYRWSGTAYVEISQSLALGETSSTAYPGNKGKKNADDIADHKLDYDNPHRVTKEQVGLDKVDNTRDIDKPLSTDMIEALSHKVEIEPGKGLVSLVEANKIAETNAKVDGFEETLNSEIERAVKAELAVESNLDTHKSDNNNPHGVTAEQVGLGNADNTSDLDKPISNATKEALDNLVKSIDTKIGNIDLTPYATKKELDNLKTSIKEELAPLFEDIYRIIGYEKE